MCWPAFKVHSRHLPGLANEGAVETTLFPNVVVFVHYYIFFKYILNSNILDLFGFTFFFSANQASLSGYISFATEAPINLSKDDRRGWVRTYDLTGEVWWPTFNVPSQHMLGIAK